jgi:metal-responsive CopG/Arc/MetJ family transcriptional regulator
MGKAKMTVTIDKTLIEELDRLSERRKQTRSRIVEEAVRSWQRWQMEMELTEGYRAMAKEDAETAEARLRAGLEALK